MKNVAFFFIFVFLSSSIFSTPLNWKNTANLYDHLVEVNKEWLKISDDGFLCKVMNFENDTERIQMHLRLVEKYLRQNTPKELNHNQLKNRVRALDILNTYWKDGNFPINTFHKVRQPYFVDHLGTTCAVGYLALKTGENELVNRISEAMNFAYVMELKDHYPQLLDWANEFGFTLGELAWIQPGYPPIHQNWNTVGDGDGTDGIINIIVADGDETLYLAGNFTQVDGVSANSIISWDGNEWHTLGEGVTGVIHDIEIDNFGTVYIGGEFFVNSNPDFVNLAYWKDGEWQGYATSNMNGVIYTIHLSARMFVGGDFEIEDENGNIIRDLAFVKYNDIILLNNDGDLSVNGPVYDLDSSDNNLLVTGNFTQTAFFSNNPNVNQIETNYLAYWNHHPNYNWISGFNPNLGPLGSAKIDNSKIYVGPKNTQGNVGFYDAGLWNYIPMMKLDQNETGFVNGILPFNDMVIYYGNIDFIPIVGTWSRGVYVHSSTTYGYGADFNAPVTAAERFQNQIYFAGQFTSVQEQAFPGLVSTPFDGVTSTEEINQKDEINIYASTSQINVQYEALQADVSLLIYNLNGQLVKQTTLPSGATETSIATQDWAAGMYIYKLVGNGVRESGKLVVF